MTEKLLLVNKSENNGIYRNEAFINYNISVVRLSEDTGKPRNTSHNRFDDKVYQFFDDIQISCLVSTDNDTAFGFSVAYRSPYSVKQNDAEKMYKTLKRINNKLDKYEKDYGRSDDFGTFVFRAANAMGIKKIIFRNDYNRVCDMYDDSEYTIYKLSKGIEILNKMVDVSIKYVNNG